MADQHVRAFAWADGQEPAREQPLDETLALIDEGSFAWIHLRAASDALLKAADRLRLHPLAVEDCLHGFQTPRVSDYGSHLFVIWHVLEPHGGHDHHGSKTELDVFVGRNYVVSHAKRRLADIEALQDRVLAADSGITGRPDWVLHALLDVAVDAYFPMLDRVTDEADRLEDEMFEDPDPEELQALFGAKRRLLWMRKTIAPERDALAMLSRHEAGIIGAESLVYFQDVYDHLNRQIDMVDTAREIVSGALDVYLSSVSNRMNEVMKRLTVVATIFMPATLIASLYGMNFARMPGLRSDYGFWGVLVGIAVLSAWMLWAFRRRGWW